MLHILSVSVSFKCKARKKLLLYYIVICGLCGCTIFFLHYLINGVILGGKNIEHKNVMWFCVQLLSETFHILRRTQRDIITNVHTVYVSILFLTEFNEA
jgi:hypothetical protein